MVDLRLIASRLGKLKRCLSFDEYFQETGAAETA